MAAVLVQTQYVSCTCAKINVLGVPITLPNMALQASLQGNCCLHFIDYPITLNPKQSCDRLIYMCILFKFNHSFTWNQYEKLC